MYKDAMEKFCFCGDGIAHTHLSMSDLKEGPTRLEIITAKLNGDTGVLDEAVSSSSR